MLSYDILYILICFVLLAFQDGDDMTDVDGTDNDDYTHVSKL